MNDLALVAVIGIALAFDFTNGFHDAANSIATVVATRVLTPRLAVVWAAAFNFIAFLVLKTHVAAAIAKGVVDPKILSIGVVFAGLVGAITWNLVTYCLGHGGNDAQKTMGVIFALLIATHKVSASGDVPLWVVLAAHSAIAAGTLTGGWRVVHTLGSRITKLQPHGGVAAESAAAATIFFVTAHGIPVSTTHSITGSIVG